MRSLLLAVDFGKIWGYTISHTWSKRRIDTVAQLPQPGNTGFTLGGFLILAALGTFLWKGAPLDSVRPSSEQSGWYEHKLAQQIPARLWQDPFKAVYLHEQNAKSAAS